MTTERATLLPGQWFMYPIDSGIPSQVTIFTGDVYHRRAVRKVTRWQALALCRWYRDPGLYHSYKDGNGRWREVYVIGDIDACMFTVIPPKCRVTIWTGFRVKTMPSKLRLTGSTAIPGIACWLSGFAAP